MTFHAAGVSSLKLSSIAAVRLFAALAVSFGNLFASNLARRACCKALLSVQWKIKSGAEIVSWKWKMRGNVRKTPLIKDERKQIIRTYRRLWEDLHTKCISSPLSFPHTYSCREFLLCVMKQLWLRLRWKKQVAKSNYELGANLYWATAHDLHLYLSPLRVLVETESDRIFIFVSESKTPTANWVSHKQNDSQVIGSHTLNKSYKSDYAIKKLFSPLHRVVGEGGMNIKNDILLPALWHVLLHQQQDNETICFRCVI